MKKRIILLLSFVLICAMMFSSCIITSNAPLAYELNEEEDGYIVSAIITEPFIVVSGGIIPETYEGLPVVKIKEGGFAGWKDLYEIYIPGSVKEIGTYAFGASGLQFAQMEEGVERIGDYAFANTYLELVFIPSTVEYIGVNAFGLCAYLELINFAGTMNEWKAIEKGDQEGLAYGVVVNCSDGFADFEGNPYPFI